MDGSYGLYLVYGLVTKSVSVKQKNHRSAARYQAWQHDEGEEETIKRMAEKKKRHIGRFKLFLHK